MQTLTWQTNAFGDVYSPQINAQAFSQHAAEQVFKRFLPAEYARPHHLTLVVGSDGGLLLPYLQALAEEHKIRFYCIDFAEVNQHTRDAGWEDTPQVQLVDDGFGLGQLQQDESLSIYFLRREIQMVPALAAMDKHVDYQPLWDKYHNAFQSFGIATNQSNNKSFIDAQLSNSGDLIHPAKALEGAYAGKTAVLLGGGPSVGLLLDWVREHRDQVVVFAANRLSARLKQENLAPDFFVAVDPQPALLDYCRDMFAFAEQSILLVSAFVAPNVLLQWPGRIAYADEALPFNYDDRLYEQDSDDNLTVAGPTVMNFALKAANYAGCDRIIMAGVDLCYSREGFSHEASSLESQLGKFLKAGGSTVETFDGQQANTDPQMALARAQMAQQVKHMQSERPDLSIIQVNSHAAKVEGIECLAVSELPTPEAATQAITEKLKEHFSWSSVAAKEAIEYRLSEMDKRVRGYRKLRTTLKGVLVDIRRLDRLQDNSFSHAVKNVNKAKAQMEEIIGDEVFLLFDYAYFDYLKVVAPLESEDNMTLKETQTVLLSYFEAADKSLLSFGKKLQDTADALRLRLRELGGECDEAMLQAWLSRGEPGRGQVWRAHHAAALLSAEQASVLARADEAFAELLANKVPSFKDRFSDRDNRLKSLWQQVTSAHLQQDLVRLEDLAEHLQISDDHDFSALGLYAKVCALFYRDDVNAFYAQIDQITHERLKVPALQLKLQATLRDQNPRLALEVIESLCRYSTDYFQHYAVLAGILGLNDLAEQAYRIAIANAQEDVFLLRRAWLWAKQTERDGFVTAIEQHVHHLIPSQSASIFA